MFAVARNAHGRPMLMHLLDATDGNYSACGLDMTAWSREYFVIAIQVLLCKKCAKKVNR